MSRVKGRESCCHLFQLRVSFSWVTLCVKVTERQVRSASGHLKHENNTQCVAILVTPKVFTVDFALTETHCHRLFPILFPVRFFVQELVVGFV